MTQMGCRSSGTQEEAIHCCLHSSALGAFEPAAGARRSNCGESSSCESFTWSVSVGGRKGLMERAGLALGTQYHPRPRTDSPPPPHHHHPHQDPRSHHPHPQSPSTQERFTGEEVDRTWDKLGYTKVSRPLNKKRWPLREERQCTRSFRS